MLGISDKVKNRSEPKSIIKYLLEQIVIIRLIIDKFQENES